MEANPHREMAVAGSGAIATGLAALASAGSERVWLLARSAKSAERVSAELDRACPRVDGGDADRDRRGAGALPADFLQVLIPPGTDTGYHPIIESLVTLTSWRTTLHRPRRLTCFSQ